MTAGRTRAALFARAKLNLRLDVLGRQPGGLHEVRSLIGDLEVADDVRIVEAPGPFSVTCEGADIPERENLAWTAATRLGVKLDGLHVRIRKRIPMQSGLGGGSSDAAAVLRGLGAIFAERGTPIAEQRFRAAARVGSDVAACLVPGFKFVEGVGDIVSPVAAPPPPWGIILLRPLVGVPTSEAYRLLDAARDNAARPETDSAIVALRRAIGTRNFALACKHFANDFESVVTLIFPEVADARERLRCIGAGATLLCGSGSCMAGFFETRAAADSAFEKLVTSAGEWTAVTGFVRA